MLPTDIVTRACWVGGDATLMARIMLDGVLITQGDIDKITRYDYLQETNPNEDRELVGTATELVIADVVFDSLQAGDMRWGEDSPGYNFLDVVAASVLTEANRVYEIRYVFECTVGAEDRQFVVGFDLPTQE